MLNVLIPMAGEGKRFIIGGFDMPKPMIDVLGKPMIEVAVETLGIPGRYIFIIKKQHGMFGLKKLLSDTYPTSEIIEIDYTTEGAACTCLLAERFINNSDGLVIANCDQIMEWNGAGFVKHVNSCGLDGVVVTYHAYTDKNSYVKLDENGHAVRFAEKEVISDESLNGIHYWKHGRDFVDSANAMIEADERVNNEFYIAPTYNYMVEASKKIGIYHVDSRSHHAIGTPADLYNYVNRRLVNGCS